jgi:hypothetical protein
LVFALRLGFAHGLLVPSLSRAFLLRAQHSWLVGCLATTRLGQGLATLSLLVEVVISFVFLPQPDGMSWDRIGWDVMERLPLTV